MTKILSNLIPNREHGEDMEHEAIKLVRKAGEKISGASGGGGNNGSGNEFGSGFGAIAASLFILLLAYNSFYTVDIEEEAVVTRFGKYLETTEPGLHYKLPFIDKVFKVQSKKRQEAVFGFRKVSGIALTMSVSTVPGTSALTRIPLDAS